MGKREVTGEGGREGGGEGKTPSTWVSLTFNAPHVLGLRYLFNSLIPFIHASAAVSGFVHPRSISAHLTALVNVNDLAVGRHCDVVVCWRCTLPLRMGRVRPHLLHFPIPHVCMTSTTRLVVHSVALSIRPGSDVRPAAASAHVTSPVLRPSVSLSAIPAALPPALFTTCCATIRPPLAP